MYVFFGHALHISTSNYIIYCRLLNWWLFFSHIYGKKWKTCLRNRNMNFWKWRQARRHLPTKFSSLIKLLVNLKKKLRLNLPNLRNKTQNKTRKETGRCDKEKWSWGTRWKRSLYKSIYYFVIIFRNWNILHYLCWTHFRLHSKILPWNRDERSLWWMPRLFWIRLRKLQWCLWRTLYLSCHQLNNRCNLLIDILDRFSHFKIYSPRQGQNQKKYIYGKMIIRQSFLKKKKIKRSLTKFP